MIYFLCQCGEQQNHNLVSAVVQRALEQEPNHGSLFWSQREHAWIQGAP